MLLKMLNISHTANTYVGDAFVRGVSGGERKRVSIAEMMATRGRVMCFDNSTRGLDASTALDFVKAMRAMTDILGQTTFATLYVTRFLVLLPLTQSFSVTRPAKASMTSLTKLSFSTRADRSISVLHLRLGPTSRASATGHSLVRAPRTTLLDARTLTNASLPPDVLRAMSLLHQRRLSRYSSDLLTRRRCVKNYSSIKGLWKPRNGIRSPSEKLSSQTRSEAFQRRVHTLLDSGVK